MTRLTPTCAHERDVLDLVAMGQWPSRADAVLRAHVDGCATCAEVATVAAAVQDWAESGPAVKVPDASVVWYRAQVRAREDAARRATRPVAVAQLVGLITVVMAGMVAVPGWSWFVALLPDWSLSLPSLSLDVARWWPEWPTLDDMRQWSGFGWAILAAGVAWLIAGSIAIVATRD